MKLDKKTALDLVKVIARYEQLLIHYRAKNPGVFEDPNFHSAYDVDLDSIKKELAEFLTGDEPVEDCPCGCCDDDDDLLDWDEGDEDDIDDDDEEDEEADEDDSCFTVSALKLASLPKARSPWMGSVWFERTESGTYVMIDDSNQGDVVKTVTRHGKSLEWTDADGNTDMLDIGKFPREWIDALTPGEKHRVI